MILKKNFQVLITAVFILAFPFSSFAQKPENVREVAISESDFKNTRNADYHANRGKWLDAVLHAKKASDPAIYKLFFWRQLIAGKGEPKFSEITRFINENPNWPDMDILLRRAEETLTAGGVSNEVIIDWFSEKRSRSGNISFKEPVTTNGKKNLIDAIIARSAELADSGYKLTLAEVNRTDIERFVRESWVEGNFSAREEWDFLTKHKERLRQKDYIDRIDRLLWDNKIEDAQRIMNLIDSDYKSLFEARIKLRTHKFGLDNILDSIPNYLKNDHGLLYDRIKWREKYGNDKDVVELLLQVPRNPEYPDVWWRLKKKYISYFMEKKNYDDAYKLTREHGFTEDIVGFAEAEWMAGWIALRFTKKPRNAYRHFYRIYHRVTTPISLGRASYWAGRAAEENNNENIAQKWYTVASKFPTSYYGQLATEKIGRATLYLPRQPIPTWADINQYNNNEFIKVAFILFKLGRHSQARKFLKHAVNVAKTTGEQMLIAEFGLKINRMDYSVVTAKEATRKEGILLIDTHYPVMENLKDVRGKEILSPEKALIHSIIMQESLFDDKAQSHAGARGLMQIIPGTAKETAGKLGIKYSKNRLTGDPKYNITLGSKYISDLIKAFRGSYILAIASYNGGATNVKRWMNANGDPRKFKDVESVIDWIEKIPFEETQNYVQRVIENLQMYRYVLDKNNPPLVKTSEDITR